MESEEDRDSTSQDVQPKPSHQRSGSFVPPEDEDEDDPHHSFQLSHDASAARHTGAWLLKRREFDFFMGIIIFVNLVQMITEIDRKTTCEDEACDPHEGWGTNILFLSIYTAEVVLRLFVLRGFFFLQPLSVLDLTVVLLGLAEVILLDVVELPNLKMLRLFRVTRVSRIARVLKHFPTLYVLVRGFTRAMEAMFWGFLLIMVMLVLWAMIAVDTIHSISSSVHSDGGEAWCVEAFSSTLRATLFFFQTLMAEDEWGVCAIPVITAEPWTFTIFAGALVSIQLGFANLIVAIIVDRAVQARDADNEDVIKEKRAAKIKFSSKLKRVLEDVDEDRSGTITLDEMMHGYDKDPSVRSMLNLMDLDRADLHKIFNLMEGRNGETVSRSDFVSVFQKAQLQDMRVYLMVMNLQIQSLAGGIQEVRELLPGGSQNPCTQDHVRASFFGSLASEEVSTAAAAILPYAGCAGIESSESSSQGNSEGPAGDVGEVKALPSLRSVSRHRQYPEREAEGEQLQERTLGTLVLDQELHKLSVSLRAQLADFSRDVAEGAAELARQAAVLELRTLAAACAGAGAGPGDAVAGAVCGKAASPELPLTSREALAAACDGAGLGGRPASPRPLVTSLEKVAVCEAFATKPPGKEIESGVCAQAEPHSDSECASNDGAKEVACWCPLPQQRR